MAALRQIAFHGKGIGMSKQKRKPKPPAGDGVHRSKPNPTRRSEEAITVT
ncbi:hypothetical protein [Sinorhizobium medicae]|nr:hypothetical protein [Sinorhizobium medicae]MDX0967847.1 hypothetical protein [Sinorhizobium medicae]MQV50671.1 hypothetical protein [Sinorhizobium medicae]MQV51848.1 hypothetical protein [Sinorhizobium medicae]MQV70938.1 hypothetical protein [Sinorhizobium medicae]